MAVPVEQGHNGTVRAQPALSSTPVIRNTGAGESFKLPLISEGVAPSSLSDGRSSATNLR